MSAITNPDALARIAERKAQDAQHSERIAARNAERAATSTHTSTAREAHKTMTSTPDTRTPYRPTTGTTTTAPQGLWPVNPHRFGDVEWYAYDNGLRQGRAEYVKGREDGVILPREEPLSGEWSGDLTPFTVAVEAYRSKGYGVAAAQGLAIMDEAAGLNESPDAWEAGYRAAWPTPRMSYTVRTWADAYGLVHAEVRTAWTLSENDPRREYRLDTYWASIRSTARRAIRRELAQRDAIGEGYRIKLEVVSTLDPRGQHFGSGLSNGAEFKESA